MQQFACGNQLILQLSKATTEGEELRGVTALATPEICAALVFQMGSLGAIRRGMLRGATTECPTAGVGVLALLDKHGRLRLGELSELLDVDLSVTSRHVSYLTKRGLAVREPDPDDRRGRVIGLTQAGADVLSRSQARYADSVSERLHDWSDEDVARLTELLARLRVSFEPHPHPTKTPHTHRITADR